MSTARRFAKPSLPARHGLKSWRSQRARASGMGERTMTMHKWGWGLVLTGVSAALCLAPFDAPAQDQGQPQNLESEGSLEEVIVTARKRDEAVIDVPVAINVFTAADIESAGIERPQDFIDLTP